MQALRRERAEERSTKRVVVDRAIAAQDLCEGGRRAIELDGNDESAREVNAVGSSAILDELEGAIPPRTMQRPEEITERRRAQTTGEPHAQTVRARAWASQVLGRDTRSARSAPSRRTLQAHRGAFERFTGRREDGKS